jgi:hypothetical protein
MLAGKFVMLMYTVRTLYTVLVLLGFSLKHAVPQDPHNVCRQGSHARRHVFHLKLLPRDWRYLLCSEACQPPESIVVNALLAKFYIAPVITAGFAQPC